MKLMRELTDEEIIKISYDIGMGSINYESDPTYYNIEFARAILDAAWIKTQDPLKDGK